MLKTLLASLLNPLRTDTVTTGTSVNITEQMIGKTTGNITLTQNGFIQIYLNLNPNEAASVVFGRYLTNNHNLETWRFGTGSNGVATVTMRSVKGQNVYINFSRALTSEDELSIIYTPFNTFQT